MWTLGKLAALAASARIATRQQDARAAAGRAHRPRARDPRARDAAPVRRSRSPSVPTTSWSRRSRALRAWRCGRPSLTCARRSSARSDRALARTGTTLREQFDRLRPGYADVPVEIDWAAWGRGAASGSSRWPSRCSARRCATALARAPHARRRARSTPTTRPSCWRSERRRPGGPAGTGMGLRLAAAGSPPVRRRRGVRARARPAAGACGWSCPRR